MTALGVGLIFAGYAIAFTGYVLFKRYDVTLGELWSPVWPPGAAAPGTAHSELGSK